MKNIFKNIGLAVVLLSMFTFSCSDDIDPVITELNTDRVFAPVNLTARIRNQTTIEVDWTTSEAAQEYVVEFYEDSLDFNSVVRTVTVLPDALPVRETFFGDTRYSLRVRTISADPDKGESTWAEATVRTEAENIFLPFQDYDLLWNDVTFRFPENSEVTRVVVNPGNIEKAISAQEAAAGAVTVSGLTGLSDYTVTLYSNNSARGMFGFTTLIDPTSPNVTVLNPGDDIAGAVTAAPAGNTIVLNPGDYVGNSSEIIINKAVTIRGQYPYDKPVIYSSFGLEAGAGDFFIIDLEMNGQAGGTATVINLESDNVEYGPVSISGCYIYDYGRQLISGNAVSTLASFSVDNSIVADFVSGGGDFIDFRKAYVAEITLTNSTFINTPGARDFIRMDDASDVFPGRTSTVLIDHCTIYGASNSKDRILYVRFLDNDLAVVNTLIAETDAFYTRESNASPINMNNNNYFNAEGFHTAGYRSESGFQYDQGSYFTLDPGFVDAENRDFTVTNQTILDNAIGDPRWR